MATRVYRITIGENDRLVRATHPANALRHVASATLNVTVASQDDLIAALADGVPVETITAEQQEL